jgi:hypothetical protein
MRKEPLDELVRLIRQGERYPRLHSLLIVRNGHLVVEECFAGYSRETLHTLQSVSKSFSSALIGIALSQGDIKSVEEKVLDFFPKEMKIDNRDERKAAIALRDLLTMRSGTDYHERSSSSPHFQLNRLKRGWDTFYLNRPKVSSPEQSSCTTVAESFSCQACSRAEPASTLMSMPSSSCSSPYRFESTPGSRTRKAIPTWEGGCT